MKKKTRKALAIGIPCGILATLLIVTFSYLSVYYKAKNVNSYFESHDSVTIRKTANYYFFDGSGTENVFIFYPGAKVEAKAYAPVMYALAERGIDAYVIKMPFHMAFFGQNKADKIIAKGSYQHYYMGGHSLGGVVASFYLNKTKRNVDGLCLMASYSTVDFSTKTSFRVLSVYGSKDGVLNLEKYDECKTNLPADFKEVVIEGGNHAGFASYGKQKGDNDATISQSEQWAETTEAITSWIKG